MKVLAVIFIYVACVAARGSGPYLPRGWKPEGPAFFLPSEVSKQSVNRQIEVIFPESEASGSDFLREYGPPNVQEVSQDIAHQGLPDEVYEQNFAQIFIKSDDVEKSNVVIQVIEEKAEVNSEEGAVDVTESQKNVELTTPAIQLEINAEQEVAQENPEISTTVSFVEAIENIEETAYVVKPTLISTTQESINEIRDKSVTELVEKADAQQILIQGQESEQQLDSQVEESALVNNLTTQDINESNIDEQQISDQYSTKQSDSQVKESAVVDVTSTQETNKSNKQFNIHQEESALVNNLTTQDINESNTDEQQISDQYTTRKSDIQVKESAVVEVTNAQDTNESNKQLNSHQEESALVDVVQVITKDSNENSVIEIPKKIVIDTNQVVIKETESKQLDRHADESAKDASQSDSQQESSSVVSKKETVSQQAEIKFEVTSTVEKKVETVEEEIKKVEQVVQNIPDVIASLEQEIKDHKAQQIQNIPDVVQETLGSLEETPEGFLEYGPPGFTEYGPPKDDLQDNTIEEKTPKTHQSNENHPRQRRFSPKLRSSLKL